MARNKMTLELANQVIDGIFEGKSFRKSLEECNVTPRSFYEFVDNHPLLQKAMTRAQQTKADLLADEIIEISDKEPDVNRARVMTDNRKWYASKMQPQRYGDRLDVNLGLTVDLSAALAEAKARVLPKRDQSQVIEGEIVQFQQLTHDNSTGSKPVTETKDAEETTWDFISS